MTDCHLKSCEFYGNSLIPNPCEACHVKNIECRYVTSYVTQTVMQAICLGRNRALFAKATDETVCSMCKARESGVLTPQEEVSLISHDFNNYCTVQVGTCELLGETEKRKAVLDKLAYFYSKLLRISSDDISLCLKLGEIAVRRRRYEKAREYYSKALQHHRKGWKKELSQTNPQQRAKGIIISDLYCTLGSIYRLDLAIQLYTKALEVYPQNSHAYISRADAYKRMKEYDKAISDYSKAIGINPQNADYYRYQAEVYMVIREYNKAIKNYTRILEISSDKADIYTSRGRLYVKVKSYDRAVADYSAAIGAVTEYYRTINHNYVTYKYLDRAMLYIAMHRYDDAIKDCVIAIESYPDNAKSYRIRSFAYRKIGKCEDAFGDWKRYKAIREQQRLGKQLEKPLSEEMRDKLRREVDG